MVHTVDDCGRGLQDGSEKHAVGFVMESLTQSISKWDEGDLMIVRRTKAETISYELWTLQEIKAKKLILVPDSTQMLSRHYTAQRSVIIKNTVDYTSTEAGRRLMMDGRVRANPTSESKHSFCLYWMVQITDDKNLVNMERTYVNTTCEVNMSIGDQNVIMRKSWGANDMPSVPVLINPRPIPAHVQILAGVDANMQKLIENDEKKKATRKICRRG